MIDIFLIGSARSGTSLFLNYICANYQFSSFPESHFYSKYGGDFNIFRESTHYTEICEFLCVNELSSFEEIGHLIKRNENERIIEKTPRHLRHLCSLPKNAHFILIKRNLKDTILSNYTAPWNHNRSIARIIVKVLVDRFYMITARLFFKSRLSIVDFDEFLIDPETTLLQSLAEIRPVSRVETQEVNYSTAREYWKVQSNTKLLQRKKTLGAWPRFGTTNIRNTLMYDSLEKLGNVKIFDLKSEPLLGLFCDAVHLHWPEKAFEGKSAPLKLSVFLVYCFVLRIGGTKIMQTVHNDWESHVSHKYRFFYKLYQRMVNLYLIPSKASLRSVPKNSKYKFLPLGLYPKITTTTKKNYHLIIGRLTRKKGILEQLAIMLPKNDFLVVAGSAEDAAYEQQIYKASEIYGVETHIRLLNEDDMHQLVSECKSVIVNYKDGLNSGILTLAATYNKPVVTNMTHIKRDMRRVYGQIFSDDVFNLNEYENTGLDIQCVAGRLNKIIKGLVR